MKILGPSQPHINLEIFGAYEDSVIIMWNAGIFLRESFPRIVIADFFIELLQRSVRCSLYRAGFVPRL